MGKVIIVGATKGGVGKSVSTYNLAYSLASMGKRVLAVDFDSQANLSTCFGIEDTAAVPVTIGHLMMAQIEDEELPDPSEYIQSRNGVDFIPSSMVLSAVDAVLLWYERPADQSDAVQIKRAGYGEGYLKKYGGTAEKPVSGGMTNAECPFLVRVTVKELRIRKGAGTDTEWTGKYVPVGTYTIVEVKEGKGSDAGWGRLKSGAGWIALSHAKRV